MQTDAHDPIDRQLPGEDRFPLMGRDPLSTPLIRLYAVMLEGKYDKIPALVDACVRASKSRTPRPHKDYEHAWSARTLADRMDAWRIAHMRETPVNRVNALPEQDDDSFQVLHTHNELKNARPPAEPEEAN